MTAAAVFQPDPQTTTWSERSVTVMALGEEDAREAAKEEAMADGAWRYQWKIRSVEQQSFDRWHLVVSIKRRQTDDGFRR